MYLLNRLLL